MTARLGLALLCAALLEVGGDAAIRAGLHSNAAPIRIAWMAAGAIVLLAYGVAVNAPGWEFGRLLGAYVAIFFIVAQIMDAAAFGHRPTLPVLCGGTLIIAGGLIVALWEHP